MFASGHISCIMVTRDRRPFLPQAISCWQRQNHSQRELVVVDTGSDAVDDVLPNDGRVRYLRRSGLTLGEARNVACTAATGAVIAHWDDDDWSRPDRLSRQLRCLAATRADVCGLGQLSYYDLRSRAGWRYRPRPHDSPWLAGGTLMYRRETWQRNPFPAVRSGEDLSFLAGVAPERLAAMPDDGWYVALLHGSNTSSSVAADGRWTYVSPEALRQRTGAAWPPADLSDPLKQPTVAKA